MIDLDISFTEDDYRGSERSQSVLVTIQKNSRIASNVTLTVNPLMVDQAEGLQVEIPENNPRSPNRAGT